jgi:hypothetical protein
VDFRSDIYSLGITLFEMLYGFVPFQGATIQNTFRRCLEDPIPPREALNPDVPPGLDAIMRKMTSRDPLKRYNSYADLIFDLQKFLKGIDRPDDRPAKRILRPASMLWGNLYDRPFPEILAEIARRSLTGRLLLHWMDLRKELHFKNGRIKAVYSNQEGEKFVECVLKNHRISIPAAREALSRSSSSVEQYLSITREANPEALQTMARDLHTLARQIMKGLFRQSMGDFVFEEGGISEQYGLDIDPYRILVEGIKDWMDIDPVKRRIPMNGCRIELNPQFQEILRAVPASPSDVFLLFRFENSISFDHLQTITGIAEENFARLIYLFLCLRVLDLAEQKYSAYHITPRYQQIVA